MAHGGRDALVFAQWGSVLGLVASVLTSILFVSRFLWFDSEAPPPRATPSPASSGGSVEDARFAAIEQRVAALENLISRSTAESVVLGSLERRVRAIESSVVDSPGKALQVPLLAQRVDDLEERFAQRLEASEAQAEDADEDTKWIIGGLVLGMFGLAIPVSVVAFQGRGASTHKKGP